MAKRQLSEETLRKRAESFRKHLFERMENEVGNTYWRYKIVGVDYDRTNLEYERGYRKGGYVICKCSCGNPELKTVQFNALKRGDIKSCGCSSFNNPLMVKDLTGQTFGRLLVIGRDLERDSESNKGGTHWLCKCSCGNPEIKSVSGSQLKSGKTQSCGCYASERIAQRNIDYSTKVNAYSFKEDYVVGINNETKEEFLISKEDYEYIKNWYWRKDNKGYWIANGKYKDGKRGKNVRMHQLVAERMYGEYNHKELFPDHLSRNKSDNRRSNLELKSNMDNMKNRSLSKANKTGKTGVSFNKENNKYAAAITINYKTNHLGYFNTFEEAVAARKEAEELYGFTCDDVTAADLSGK